MYSLKSLCKAPARHASGIATVAALMLSIIAAPAAQAIPPNQKDFDTTEVETSLANALVPGAL